MRYGSMQCWIATCAAMAIAGSAASAVASTITLENFEEYTQTAAVASPSQTSLGLQNVWDSPTSNTMRPTTGEKSPLLDTTEHHGGSQSMKVWFNNDPGQTSIVETKTTSSLGQSPYDLSDATSLSLWYKFSGSTNSAKTQTVKVLIHDTANNGYTWTVGALYGSIDWTEFSVNPADATSSVDLSNIDYLQITMAPSTNDAGPATIWIDDITATVPEPGSLALVALGGTCLLFKRRKAAA